jgi:hypothetical protein
MALINCPECTKQVSDKAAACPHCGHPIADGPSTAPSAPPSQVGSPPGDFHTLGATPEQTSVPKPLGVGEPSWQPFVHFLTASVKDVHPTAPKVGGIWLSPARKVNAVKEIAYQQRRFVDFGKTLVDTQPWVTLLTCVKHGHVEDCYELSAARFPEMADKKFWDELTVDVQATRAGSEKVLDNVTVQEVKELCECQSVADKLAIAPETLRRLRECRRLIESKKSWIKRVSILFAGMILAGIGAAVTGTKELRNLVGDPSINLRPLQDDLVGLAVLLGIGGFITAIYAVVKTGGAAADYLALFTMNIAPILRSAGIDPATCTDNLDYVKQVIDSVEERYRYLEKKFLQPFLASEAAS